MYDIERLKADLAQLQADEKQAELRLQTLRRDTTRLSNTLEVLSQYTVEGVEGEEPPKSVYSVYADMTIAEAVEHYLKEVGGTARMTDIRNELARAGKLGGRPDSHYGTLVQTVQRHPGKFEQRGKGIWALASKTVDLMDMLRASTDQARQAGKQLPDSPTYGQSATQVG